MGKILTYRETNAKSNFTDLALDAYLLNALNASPKDRSFIIKVESNLIQGLLRPTSTCFSVEFGDLNSYYRMLAHRVARYYDLEHTTEGDGRTVVVWRPSTGKERPLLKLADLVEPEGNVPPPADTRTSSSIPKFTIMKRDPKAANEWISNNNSQAKPSLSLEERERQYEEARARIFKDLEHEHQQGQVLSPDTTKITQLETTTVVTNPDCQSNGDLSPITASPEGPQMNDWPSGAGVSPSEIPSYICDQVQFPGWKNVEEIKPYLPSNPHSMPSSNVAPSAELAPFDFGSVWIPQHILIAVDLPRTEAFLKAIKQRIKRNHSKLYIADEGDKGTGIILFSYRNVESEDEIGQLLGTPCERWRPTYLPEPAILW